MGLVYTDCYKSGDSSSDDCSSDSSSHGKLLRCKFCHNQICKSEFLMSDNFHGSTGPAYYVSHVLNCDLLKPEIKEMLTGKYKVASLTCKQCGVDMGWKYLHSSTYREKYKEGNYVIELDCLEMTDC